MLSSLYELKQARGLDQLSVQTHPLDWTHRRLLVTAIGQGRTVEGFIVDSPTQIVQAIDDWLAGEGF